MWWVNVCDVGLLLNEREKVANKEDLDEMKCIVRRAN